MASNDNEGQDMVVDKNIPMVDKSHSGARSEHMIRTDSSGRSEAKDYARDYKSRLSKMLMNAKAIGLGKWSHQRISSLKSMVNKEKSLLWYKEYHNGETALHIASEFGILTGAKVLIELGADIEATDRDDRRPLHIACLYGQTELVKLFLDKGADFEATDCDGRRPLHTACLHGQSEVVKLLLDKGADFEARQYQGATPLDDAVKHVAVVDLLLEYGAKTQVQNNDGWSPLHTAVEEGTTDVLKRLLKDDKSNIDKTENNEHWTALNLAVYLGKREFIPILLESGAGLDIADRDGWTPWMTATQEHPDMIKVLHTALENEIFHLEVRDTWKDTPLLAATRHGKWESAASLIEIGADCTAEGFNGRTPLHWACINGHEITVKLILSKEIRQIYKAANDGCTALLFASGARSVDASYPGAKLTSDRSYEEDESMDESQPGRYRAVINLLLKKGADRKAQSKRQETALHYAASRGSLGRLDPILEKADEADLSSRNQNRWTALRCAFEGDQRSVAVPRLIRSGKVEKADFGSDTAHAKLWNDLFEFFADNPETHGVLDWLIKNMIRISIEQLNSIQWLARKQIPKAVSLLISKADGDSTVKQIDNALEYVLRVAKTSPEVSSDTEFIKVLYMLINASVKSSRIETLVEETLANVRRALEGLEEQQRRARAAAYTSNFTSNEETREETTEKGESVAKNRKTPPTAKHKKRGKVPGNIARANEDDYGDNRLRQMKNLEDILSDRQFTHAHQYIRSFPSIECKPGDEDRLKMVTASVTQFFQSHEKSGTILRYRSAKDVIFRPGPKEIMKKAVEALVNISKGVSGLPGYSFGVDTEPKFTWVHLPSTDINWMNNLLTTVMKNENCNPCQYYEIKSFFSDSLAQIPDKELPSRYMRPRTTTRSYTHTDSRKLKKRGHSESDEGISEHGNHKAKSEGSDIEESDDLDRRTLEGTEAKRKIKKDKSPYVHIPSSTAIYMPFLCFSTSTESGQNNYSREPGNSIKKNQPKVVPNADFHGSPTLDEWYYHFREDEESIKDKDHRNKNQVVTKYLKAIRRAKRPDESSQVLKGNQEKVCGPDDCTLLHVNQLWVWIIGKNWLITATSCVSDDSHNSIEKAILDLVHKQAMSGGSSSKLKSATDMSKLIVEYFIGSYERTPELEGLMSIGQIFSQYLNQIGRDECLIFEDFRKRTLSWEIPGARNGQGRMGQSSGSGDAGSPRPNQSSEAPPTASTNEEIRDAIRRTEILFTNIKDVRDELNILKAIVQYQKIVERGLAGKKVKHTDLLAENILGDIKEMEVVAERIQQAVNTTLSLQQSEIANFQATLATTQGKTVMAFTFATVIFLPLSFLSSLFALDVASFQEAPAWAFYVIFLVSAAVSLVVANVAFHLERLKILFRNAYNHINVFAESKNDDIDGGTKKAEGLSGDSDINNGASPAGLFHLPKDFQGRGESYV